MDTVIVDGIVEYETIIGGIDRNTATHRIATIIVYVILRNIVPIRAIHVHSMHVIIIDLILQDGNVFWFGN